jgi:thioester reductase-like protein
VTITSPARSVAPVSPDKVAAIAARALRIPPAALPRDVPLARLGLDSLGCMELAAEIEALAGRPVPLDAITEGATVRSLCSALEHPQAPPVDPFALMRADAVLASDVVPGERHGAPSLREARSILLTGATGFLGSALLRSLLDQTSARIVCLVRPGRQSAHSRIGKLTRGADRDRVVPIVSDLSQPRLDLDEDMWNGLAAGIDSVCHVGASINWVSSYLALRAVNVLATQDLLRLACQAGASFYFVSSLSVCYSTAAPREVDESFDPLASVEGLHFGYAQTKAVAESLVGQARARGLRATVYRPALISGDSRTGRFNAEDLLTTLISGCVRMGIVPDLDWELDTVPVDAVADSIVRLSGARGDTFHLSHPRPRHWRECALWMRLYGYDVRLVPYREWADRLRDDAALDLRDPLRALRPFFLDPTSEGPTIPELHERHRRSRVSAPDSARALATAGSTIPPLDAALMNRYFQAFVEEGVLPDTQAIPGAPPARRTADPHARDTPERLARGMLADAGIAALSVSTVASDPDHSIIGELTAWRAGSSTGLFRVTADDRDFLLKLKPDANEAIAVGEALAGLCGDRLGAAYAAWGSALGVRYGHLREVAIYRDADAVFRSLLPKVIATRSDANSRTWAILLERVDGLLMDAVERPDQWRPHLDLVIDDLAMLHSRWLHRVATLRDATWLDRPRSTADLVQMTPLWLALADHAAPLFARWVDPSLPTLQRCLIDAASIWRPSADAVPQTLIHNDFNPRNICVRRVGGALRLCAFDWELATIGAPTRDLAELLCFVSAGSEPDVFAAIDRHRRALGRLTGLAIDPDRWQAAFVAGLCELLIDRLAVYALVHRVRPQTFLPGVLKTWQRLFELCDGQAIAV